MSDRPGSTRTQPRRFEPRVSTFWWWSKGSYFAFILRELSSVFIAWFVVYLLFLVRAASQGEASYQQFLAWSTKPLVVLLNVVTLLFVVYHAITWFNLAPKAMVVRVLGRRVPGVWIAVSNYAAWALLSALTACVLLAG